MMLEIKKMESINFFDTKVQLILEKISFWAKMTSIFGLVMWLLLFLSKIDIFRTAFLFGTNLDIFLILLYDIPFIILFIFSRKLNVDIYNKDEEQLKDSFRYLLYFFKILGVIAVVSGIISIIFSLLGIMI